jgi:hypothetical protein
MSMKMLSKPIKTRRCAELARLRNHQIANKETIKGEGSTEFIVG